MKITSSVFENNNKIPSKYTCDGENINPPLNFIDVPKNTKSLVLLMDDPDAPMGTFVHWVVFSINSEEKQINEDFVPSGSIQGKNTVGNDKYIGPCPPSGTHRYFFKLYALSSDLDLDKNAGKEQVEEAMKNNIIEKSELIGLYKKI